MRISADVSGDVLQVHATIVAFETELPAHVGDLDAAIVYLDTHIRDLRDKDFVADAPPGMVVVDGLRSRGTHHSTAGVNPYAACEKIRGGLRFGRRIDTRAHQHLVP